TSFAAVKASIGAFETAYEQDPTNKLYSVDMWSGPNQVPTQSLLSQTLDLGWCNGGPIGTVPTLRFDFRQTDYPGYGALMLGYNLGAGAPGACIDGNWTQWSAEPTGLGGTWRFTYRLQVIVRVLYSGTRVLAHTFQTTQERVSVRQPSAPFNPNTAFPPAPVVETEWPGIRNKPAFVSQTAPASFMDEVRNGVNQQLIARQRAFYTQVALRCRQAGTAISN